MGVAAAFVRSVDKAAQALSADIEDAETHIACGIRQVVVDSEAR